MTTARRLVPGGRAALDHVFLVVLAALALLGLTTTFTGWEFALVGGLGLLVGVAAARVSWWRRWPPVAPILIAVVAFVVLGGPLCLRASGHALPTGAALRQLLDTVLLGWKELLTTLPPVDGHGHLLVLPWLLGLAAGVLGGGLLHLPARTPAALRTGLPLLAPVLLLVAVVLLGVRRPASLVLQGGAFAAVAILWLAVRGLDRTRTQTRDRRSAVRRMVLGAAVIGVATAIAAPASGLLTADPQRVVLRSKIVPPVHIEQYGSPLSAFRRYVKNPHADVPSLYDRTLMTVSGVPAGTRVRFATLDLYDGTVWRASETPARALPGEHANAFLHVSDVIDDPAKGARADVSVKLGAGWSGVWLPTVGALQTMHFDGGDADRLASTFRYDLATATGLAPGGAEPGDAYHFTTVLDDRTLTPQTALSTQVDPELQAAAAFVDDKAVQWSTGADDPTAQVLQIAAFLQKHGYYSDGVADTERIYHAGHYQKRLGADFLDQSLIVGDDEQYAAAMALLALRLGVPARVVMGAVVPQGGVVRGADVHAWVEVQAADRTWRTLPTDMFMGRRKPAQLPPQQVQHSKGSEAPPPAPVPPPSTLTGQSDEQLKAKKEVKTTEGSGGPHVPHWLGYVGIAAGAPLAVLAVVLGGILGAKAWRRRRRRRADRPSARVVGAWCELVDHARDLGRVVPVDGATRREQAASVGLAGAVPLAREADGHVFGPAGPSDVDAASYWTAVDAARRELSSGETRRRRVRAAVSLVTFRHRWAQDTRRPARNTGGRSRVGQS